MQQEIGLQISNDGILMPIASERLIPVIKLTEKNTHKPWEYINCSSVIVRIQDLITYDGKNYRDLFSAISESGDIHNFLGCKCNVILSTIMRDRTIYGCDIDKYIELINTLKPDYFMTLDGETYEGELNLSALEISRILSESKEIINKCKNSDPIGLIKGSNLNQAKNFADELNNLGIHNMVFHIGDFLHRGNSIKITKARLYAQALRQKCNTLILHGIGSPRYFNMFFYADAFATQSHYINAYHGKRFIGGHWIGNNIEDTMERKYQSNINIMKNLQAMDSYLKGQERVDRRDA